jgi:hypothetical protein
MENVIVMQRNGGDVVLIDHLPAGRTLKSLLVPD